MEKHAYLKIREDLDLKKDDHYIIKHYLFDAFGFLIVYGAGYFWSGLGLVLTSPIIAAILFRSFSLMHDAVHSLCSEKKWVNDVVGVFSGALSLLPFDQWRKAHLEHHFWTGNYVKDPVMALVSFLPSLPKPVRRTFSLLWKMWFPIIAILQHLVFWQISFKNTFKYPNKRGAMSLLVLSAFWGGVFAILPTVYLVCSLLPGITIYLMMVEVVNLPHHLQMPMISGEEKLHIRDQHLSARTCLYPSWFAKLVVLNFNYHAEHHMFPDAPWFKLAEIHQIIAPKLKDELKEDPSFYWILENRKKDLYEVISVNDLKKSKAAS